MNKSKCKQINTRTNQNMNKSKQEQIKTWTRQTRSMTNYEQDKQGTRQNMNKNKTKYDRTATEDKDICSLLTNQSKYYVLCKYRIMCHGPDTSSTFRIVWATLVFKWNLYLLISLHLDTTKSSFDDTNAITIHVAPVYSINRWCSIVPLFNNTLWLPGLSTSPSSFFKACDWPYLTLWAVAEFRWHSIYTSW